MAKHDCLSLVQFAYYMSKVKAKEGMEWNCPECQQRWVYREAKGRWERS